MSTTHQNCMEALTQNSVGKRKRLGLVYKELQLSIMLMIGDYILT